MKVFFLLTSLLLLQTVFVCGQVYNGSLTFSTQSEIDDFSNTGYTSVTGNVTIDDALDGQYDIRNLAGLAGLTTVNASVTITNNNLLTGTAFLNFTSVGLRLQFINNIALSSISGISNLAFVGDQINIENNASLITVTAFSNLTATRTVRIIQNPLLNDLSGLSNLSGALEFLIIENNNSLTSPQGFLNITNVTNLFIRNNPALTTLNGLNNLQKFFIASIENNASLTSMAALGNLHVARGLFTIEQNPALISIDGLANLDTLANLQIKQNNALTNIQGPVAGCVTTGRIEILDNHALTTITGFAGTKNSSIDIENNPKLSVLNAFASLEMASDFKLINNYDLVTINPMFNLREIRILEINEDTLLSNLNFLNNLDTVLEKIKISGCSRLQNLNAFANLQSTEVNDLIIGANRSLTNINGLSAIVKINQELNIGNNVSLTTLQGLRNIRSVGQTFTITALPLITNLNQLILLDSIGGSLIIANNTLLQNIDGLINLRTVSSTVFIQSNPVLSSFCGLYTLYINGGPMLGTTINQNQVNPTPAQIIAGGPCTGPLPVRLLFFNYQCYNNTIKLNWKTASEENSSHFIVETSLNGGAWTNIANIPAAGNSSSEKSYSFTYNNTSPQSFYRLAQYDHDGSVHYSGVLRASCSMKEFITAWPDPVEDKLFVSVNTTRSSKAIIGIYNNSGALIKKHQVVLFPGTTQVIIDINNIPAGMYHVNVEWNDGVMRKNIPVIKQ